MTSGFEQQEPLANSAFTRPAARPQHVGVRLPVSSKPADAHTPARPAEPRTFSRLADKPLPYSAACNAG